MAARRSGLDRADKRPIDPIYAPTAKLSPTLLGRDRQPLTVGLANLSSPHLAQENLVAAGSIMAILPPMLLFAGLSGYYVRGLFAGATKG